MDAGTYAQALIGATKNASPEEKKRRTERFLKVVRSRGHESLLPSVITSIERLEKEERKPSLTIAHKKDATALDRTIQAALETLNITEKPEIVVDERIVGGFIVRTADRMLDRSFKRPLLALYRTIVQ